jgi:hypothetical protein
MPCANLFQSAPSSPPNVSQKATFAKSINDDSQTGETRLTPFRKAWSNKTRFDSRKHLNVNGPRADERSPEDESKDAFRTQQRQRN